MVAARVRLTGPAGASLPAADEVRAQALEVAGGWSPPGAPRPWRLTAALFEAIAADDELVERVAALPADRLPALLASAAVALLVRRDRPVPLAGYFPAPGRSQPRFDDGFFPAFGAFCAARLDDIVEICRSHHRNRNLSNVVMGTGGEGTVSAGYAGLRAVGVVAAAGGLPAGPGAMLACGHDGMTGRPGAGRLAAGVLHGAGAPLRLASLCSPQPGCPGIGDGPGPASAQSSPVQGRGGAAHGGWRASGSTVRRARPGRIRKVLACRPVLGTSGTGPGYLMRPAARSRPRPGRELCRTRSGDPMPARW
jgi:hypothetical protein